MPTITPTRISRFEWFGKILSARGPKGSSARLVAVGLFNHMNKNGGGASVAVRTLRDETELSLNTVQRSIGRLLADGWVIRHETGRGQYGKPSYVYEATIPEQAVGQPAAHSPDDSLYPPRLQSGGAPMYPPPSGNVPMRENQCTHREDSLYPPRVHNLLNTFKKPLMQPLPETYGGTQSDINIDSLKEKPKPTEARNVKDIIEKAIKGWPDFTDGDIARIVPGASMEQVREVRRHKSNGAHAGAAIMITGICETGQGPHHVAGLGSVGEAANEARLLELPQASAQSQAS